MSKIAEKIESVKEHELLLPIYDAKNNYHVINARNDFIFNVENKNFDAIIFTSTFFDLVVDLKYEKIISYISEKTIGKKVVKIALPQDDYWVSEIRNNWLLENEINLVISCLEPETWPVIYQEYSKKGNIKQGYTSYLNARHKIAYEKRKLMINRTTDVFYRSNNFPYLLNELGLTKSQLGTKFEKAVKASQIKLVLDITGDVIFGTEWLKQMMNSKSVISTASGSSLIYKKRVPKTFIEITKKNFEYYTDKKIKEEFSDFVEKKMLTALGPRNLEASAVGCLQFIAWEKKLGPLEPHRDFVPFDFRHETIIEMKKMLSDLRYLEKITENNWKTLSDVNELQAISFINLIHEYIKEKTPECKIDNYPNNEKKLLQKIIYAKNISQLKFRTKLVQQIKYYQKKIKGKKSHEN